MCENLGTLRYLFLSSILAGCKALPPLLNIRQVMQQKQVSNVWSNKEELPVSYMAYTSLIKKFGAEKITFDKFIPF